MNASPEDRLSSVVSAVTACLPSYGFSSYRPIIYAVGDRLLEELQKGVEFSVNVRLPGQGGTGGRLSSTTTTTTTTTRFACDYGIIFMYVVILEKGNGEFNN